MTGEAAGLSQWLPEGKHWGLTIKHYYVPQIGKLDSHAGDKLIWHTTEGTYASAHGIFRTGHDAPHVLIDPHAGTVAQYLPLDCTALALEHPSGTPETNAAGCRQVEIAGKAAESAGWPMQWYVTLGALAVLMEHRTGIPRMAPKAFRNVPHRLDPQVFFVARGHYGHEHVPNQPAGHWDPGAFRADRLFAGMREAETRYQ